MDLKTFSFEIDSDGIALATFDVPGRSMNTLTAEAVADIIALTKEVTENDAIKGAVITSGKPSGFCAGADLGEMGSGAGGSAKKDMDEQARLQAEFDNAYSLNATLRALETCGKPIGVAINGLALGGGLEVCLAGHYRIAADDNPKLQLGLPEAKVGLLPGAGGTQRLPRLIGAQAALPMILQGSSVKAAEAKAMGIVHDTAPTADLVSRAKEWVKANPKAMAPWDQKGYKIPGGGPNSPKAAQIFIMGNAMTHAKSYGNFPAQKHILSCVYEGLQVPIDAALRIESRYFVKTLKRPEAKAMIRSLFLSLQELSKGASRPGNYARSKVEKVAVIGAGLMGAGIAHVQAMAGVETLLIDVSQEAAEKGKAYSQRILEKRVSRGKMTQDKADQVLANIIPTTDYSLIKGADFVIEAVFENQELKAEITKKAEAELADTAIFGSNTSTLPITGLAEASIRPENFIGIHFFSPVERMGLVEIIVGEKTTEETIAKTIDYVLKIKKTPIVVNDRRGFYTSRCFGTYTQEGMAMVQEGIAPAIVENVGRMSGMPMGTLEVTDSVGIDTALKISREVSKAEGDNEGAERLGFLSWVVEDQGRVGRKAGKGFYDYDEKGKPKRIWPGLHDKLDIKVDECSPELKKELSNRFLIRQAIETARCFEEGVIADARDADIGSILGWGFAPHTGGVISYIDLFWGVPAFLAEADRLADQYGERFRPNTLLREMAEKGESFYSRFGPKAAKAA